MRHFLFILPLMVLAPLFAKAQSDICLYLPLELRKEWVYVNEVNNDTLISKVVDTTTINQKFYFVYALYGEEQPDNWPKYFFRPESDKIYALNQQDSSEYLLFDFSCEIGKSWFVPADTANQFGLALNQCDWGKVVTLSDGVDSLFTPVRIYYGGFNFSHTLHSCYDAGIGSSWFFRDMGIVKLSQITEGGVIDWYLNVENDTLDFIGEFGCVKNPCLTIPCLPGLVSAVKTKENTYILEKHGQWDWDYSFVWHNYKPEMGDSVLVKGICTSRKDLTGDSYFTVEVLDLKKYVPTSLKNSPSPLVQRNFKLLRNYPNPFNNSTIIQIELPRECYLQVELFNIKGQKISNIFSGVLARGQHSIKFYTNTLSSGLYLYRVNIKDGPSLISKMLIIR